MASSFIWRMWRSAFAAALLAAVPAAASAQVTVLYYFKDAADGGDPVGSLIRDSSGALYGTVSNGGLSDAGGHYWGGVFRLTPPPPGETEWVKTTLYNFKSLADGAMPRAGLVKDAKGNLYGTTSMGGNLSAASGGGGFGTVFKLAPPAAGQTQWTKTTIYAFKGGAYGLLPGDGSLVIDGNLALYGTTRYGGSEASSGTVFKLTPPAPGQTLWTRTTLYSFPRSGGRDPVAGLVRDQQGVLYGATETGGGQDFGLVFSLTPPPAGSTVWTYRTLYAFKGGEDGKKPWGTLLLTGKGALYGTTMRDGIVTPYPGVDGNGTVFTLTPPGPGETKWSKTTLYSFKGPPDGSNPQGGLAFAPAGVLVGTNFVGGGGAGTIYKLNPPPTGKTQWTENVVASFPAEFGPYPQLPMSSLLAGPQGELYGTSNNGGPGKIGTVFKVQP